MKYSKFANLLILLILSLGIFMSCLPEEPPIPHRLELNLKVDQLESELERGDDTITISRIKFLMDHFILNTDTDARLESGVENLIFEYRPVDRGTDRQIFSGNLGFSDFKTFTAIEIFVDPAESEEGFIDSDLVVSSEFYSLYLEGEYNGSSFVYRSKPNFDKLMEYNTVTIDENLETIAVRISNTVSEFILDPQTNEIIDPTDSNNAAKIDSLFEESLEVEAIAKSSVL